MCIEGSTVAIQRFQKHNTCIIFFNVFAQTEWNTLLNLKMQKTPTWHPFTQSMGVLSVHELSYYKAEEICLSIHGTLWKSLHTWPYMWAGPSFPSTLHATECSGSAIIFAFPWKLSNNNTNCKIYKISSINHFKWVSNLVEKMNDEWKLKRLNWDLHSKVRVLIRGLFSSANIQCTINTNQFDTR